ncbi:GNAT family N-acetyltransferase [Haloarcula salinisoli]|uniref:GNAT family N-acetyltransferase n=1 Tax=Haloarcula salinisoli TaxID=2487746 RepID=A0A8J8C9M7_9EURY|nr:GNAT family N-acetyltransferase [Halomicroarcula salinisoli]MBX0287076.1 GNAT family N-acetyltransferase [Halomicroarcula salinisoli]MBX0304379.1 GNAT family N-acetyltransferase [Halomicroarcula salinisoli]
MTRDYPDEPADKFPAPPRTVTDREGREVELLAADASDHDGVLEMYLSFDPADRAQGIPPARESAIEDWLDTILGEDTLNVVAVHEGSVVGHATLVPDRHGEHELAIFVLQPFQGAGIGTCLVETLLGLAQSRGLEKVWLTVERWNDPAVALYKKVGFETTEAESFEIEMSIQL